MKDLSREEQETVIRGNATSKTWEVVTADPKIIRQLEAKGWTKDDRKNPSGYVSFTIDRLPFPRKNRRVLSESQRQNIQKAIHSRKAKQPSL